MENLSSVVTFRSEVCRRDDAFFLAFMSLVDILPFLIGQPAVAKVLWLTLTSKKAPDILNCNFAVFNGLHHWISIIHVTVLFSQPAVHDEILTFLLLYGQVGGPMNFFCICVERYVAVVHPMSYPLLKKYRFREISVVMVWFCIVCLALVFILHDITSIKDDTLQSIPMSVLVFMVAMVLRCSMKIAWALKKSGPGTDTLNPAKRKAFKIVCATSNIAFFCYSPVAFLQRLSVVRKNVPACKIRAASAMFLSIESVLQPLLYLSTHGQLCTCFKANKAR